MILLLLLCCAALAHAHNLIKVHDVAPTIQVDLRYATNNNCTHKLLYPATADAYLIRQAAESLSTIQDELHNEGLGIKIWDAYRPFSVQHLLWQHVPNANYVADPTKGSNHNRGIAVDITLIDLKTGKELEMPSEFDDFSKKAHLDYADCSAAAQHNRERLQKIMKAHGWQPLRTEWWHFTYTALLDGQILDISFDELK